MDFRISDTFTDSLSRLTGDEQKVVKTTAFDLQLNPANPGHSLHKLDRARDKKFWSVRVNNDIRIIVHKSDSSLLLCYVDHHDKAYLWAEKRKLETHPKTGAAQLVEIRERIEEVVVQTYVHKLSQNSHKPFAKITDDVLLGYGVPLDWLQDVKLADEDSILKLTDHLPAEAAEALLDIATGVIPPTPKPLVGIDPFAHPDAQRRFRVMNNVEELERALTYSWEKWTIFLHPDQQQLIERDFNGPARVSGTAGTGKTIVALHRATWLARKNPEARVLLTTFSSTLANALRTKLKRLISNEPRLAERLEVHAMDAIGYRLFELNCGKINLAKSVEIKASLKFASKLVEGHKFSLHFLWTEWDQIVDAWQLNSWDEYRDVKRLGRKTRLPETQRLVLWSIFDKTKADLKSKGYITAAEMYTQLAQHLEQANNHPFDYIVVDEAQDVSIPQLRFLAVLSGSKINGLFLAGDLGQRIFQQAFSWKSLGVDIRGRSRTLHINYRTSHQIRMQADKLLGPEISDVDGNIEERRGTISVFNGPSPEIMKLKTHDEEIKAVAAWLSKLSSEGVKPQEIGVFVRSEAQIDRAKQAVQLAGIPCKTLDEHVDTTIGFASICSMHLAKGLEFLAVVVMAVDDEVIPLQERIEQVVDDSDLTEVYDTERQLFYVACTRARDRLLVTCGDVASEFLEDLNG